MITCDECEMSIPGGNVCPYCGAETIMGGVRRAYAGLTQEDHDKLDREASNFSFLQRFFYLGAAFGLFFVWSWIDSIFFYGFTAGLFFMMLLIPILFLVGLFGVASLGFKLEELAELRGVKGYRHGWRNPATFISLLSGFLVVSGPMIFYLLRKVGYL